MAQLYEYATEEQLRLDTAERSRSSGAGSVVGSQGQAEGSSAGDKVGHQAASSGQGKNGFFSF
jgi:hypothetical protein